MALRTVESWKNVIMRFPKGEKISKRNMLIMFSDLFKWNKEEKAFNEACKQLVKSKDIRFISLS